MTDSKYSWLRDPNWPESINQDIIGFLNDENSKCKTFFRSINDQVHSLFTELKGRIKEDDFSVPIQKGEYSYYSYIKPNQSYWTHARKLNNAEEVLLDENKESLGKKFFKVGDIEASPSHELLAYSVDLNGSERYRIIVKNLASQQIVDNNVSETFETVVWHQNNQGYFYVPTGTKWRADKVYYHSIGTKQSEDILIYEEHDETFWVSPSLSSSENFLFINSASNDSNEIWYLDLTSPNFELKLLLKRSKDQLYSVTHHENSFYITANDAGKNFRLVKALISNPSENWVEIIAHNPDIYILNATAYKDHLVIEKRVLGLTEIDIINLKTRSTYKVAFKEEIYDAHHIFTTFDAKAMRYQYSSLVQPREIIETDFTTHASTLLKIQDVPSGHDPAQYITKRVWAEASDGTKVPISLLYRKDLNLPAPLYLYGYGSYGYAVPITFRTTVLSLVDRGFIYAIAHIRGGDDLGYEWYESAKFLSKRNTFNDFISSARYLLEKGYTESKKIVISGGSAGGMLIGYCINNAPELYKAAVLHVPFVDVLSTMLDETLPLTQGEFKEWGNPKDPEYYDYIKSYSPFDNIAARHYPSIFITSGLNDPRVTYWEAAKFALKLADHKLDDNPLLLKTNMEGGHKGKTGRYDALHEIAEEYAFILKAFKII